MDPCSPLHTPYVVLTLRLPGADCQRMSAARALTRDHPYVYSPVPAPTYPRAGYPRRARARRRGPPSHPPSPLHPTLHHPFRAPPPRSYSPANRQTPHTHTHPPSPLQTAPRPAPPTPSTPSTPLPSGRRSPLGLPCYAGRLGRSVRRRAGYPLSGPAVGRGLAVCVCAVKRDGRRGRVDGLT
jgi:hypothetical protein